MSSSPRNVRPLDSALPAAPDDSDAARRFERELASDAWLERIRRIESAATASLRPVGDAARLAATALDAGTRLGTYRVGRLLGAGGMGAVYEAQQEQPRRRVALKLMLSGPGLSPAQRRRFADEAELLGRLRDPGIAQIYEAGTCTLAGRPVPFFAMEHIPAALSLTEFAHRRRLSVRARVALLARVCDAVHYGHQQGIVHRDLKPANILVSAEPADLPLDRVQPKVIDFGVARVCDADLASRTRVTQDGQLVGTPGYMSPEQAAGDSARIDIRTDVYALGAILFELLTGQLPFLGDAGLRTLLEQIVRAAPPRPSQLNRAVDGELDTIVLRSLAKPPERRYPSAEALARDLRNYLAGLPIEAKRDSAGYVLRKTIWRYRVPLAATAALGLLLTAATATSLALWRRAELSRAAASASESDARRSAAIAHSVNRLLTDVLRGADRGEHGGNPDITVREKLDEALARLSAAPAQYEPPVRSAALDAIGQAYHALGLTTLAEPVLREALALSRGADPPDDAVLAECLNNLAALLDDLGQEEEAERLYREAVEVRRRHPAAPADLAAALDNLATLLLDQNRLDAAEPLLREALELRQALGPAHEASTAASLNNLAALAYQRADLAASAALFDQAVDLLERRRGPNHPQTIDALRNSAVVYAARGDLAGAAERHREALIRTRALLGDEHPDVALSLNNLGDTCRQLGQLGEAESLLRDALDLRSRLLPPEHPDIGITRGNLAAVLGARGKVAEATRLHRESVDLARSGLGGDPLDLANALGRLGTHLYSVGDPASAEPVLREALAIRAHALPDTHPDLALSRAHLASALALLGRTNDAAELLEIAERSAAANPETPAQVRGAIERARARLSPPQ